MSYFISLPKIKEKMTFFSVVPFGPLNHIVPSLTLITLNLTWIKYIFSCLLHRDFDLSDNKEIYEIILNPEFGVYNRVLTWAFEYAARNAEAPKGVLIAVDWNRNIKKNRDFFDYMEFGRFIKDILDTKDPEGFLANAKKYAEGKISEVSKDFRFLEYEFKKHVIGHNLSQFPIRDYFKEIFKELNHEHFATKRDEFVSISINYFLRQFRKVSSIERDGIIREHTFFDYVRFVRKELGIFDKNDLLVRFQRDEKSLYSIFLDPKFLRPALSDEGYDAFLMLKLLKDNARIHFHSFILSTYLRKKKISFYLRFLNIYDSLSSKGFRDHIKRLEKSLSKFGTDLKPLELDQDLLRSLAVWWEFYQFSFIGERITKDIHNLRLDELTPNEIRREISEKDLRILVRFLNKFLSRSDEYSRVLRQDEEYGEQILIQLEEMGRKPTVDTVYNHLLTEVRNKEHSENYYERAGYPFFPSLDSFEMWVDDMMEIMGLI